MCQILGMMLGDGLKISRLLRHKIKVLPSDIITFIKDKKKRTLWVEKIGGKELKLSSFIVYPDQVLLKFWRQKLKNNCIRHLEQNH